MSYHDPRLMQVLKMCSTWKTKTGGNWTPTFRRETHYSLTQASSLNEEKQRRNSFPWAMLNKPPNPWHDDPTRWSSAVSQKIFVISIWFPEWLLYSENLGKETEEKEGGKGGRKDKGNQACCTCTHTHNSNMKINWTPSYDSHRVPDLLASPFFHV